MTTAWIILLGASLLVALVAVLVFKRCSRPEKILTARNRLVARFIELFLYQDSLRALARSGGRLGISLGRYLSALLLPLLAAVAVVLPLLAFSSPLLSRKPISASSTFLVEARGVAEVERIALQPEGIAVRIPGENRVVWRCQAKGESAISLDTSGDNVRIPLAFGDGCPWIVPGWTTSPLAALLPGTGNLRAENTEFGLLRIDYPERSFEVAGLKLDWLTTLSLFSLVFSIPIAMLAKITI